MHVNFVCVIWWQVRLNQAPSGWMRGAQGSGIWGAEWWTGSGQGRRHKALFMCINMLYSSSGRHTYSQLHLFIDRFCTGCMYTEKILRLHISDHFSLTFYKDIFRVFCWFLVWIEPQLVCRNQTKMTNSAYEGCTIIKENNAFVKVVNSVI